jgi:hypothetical protein
MQAGGANVSGSRADSGCRRCCRAAALIAVLAFVSWTQRNEAALQRIARFSGDLNRVNYIDARILRLKRTRT